MWIQKIKKRYFATVAFQKAIVMFNNRQLASGPFIAFRLPQLSDTIRSVNLSQKFKFIIRWESNSDLFKTKTYIYLSCLLFSETSKVLIKIVPQSSRNSTFSLHNFN